jgi:hypothetical protein
MKRIWNAICLVAGGYWWAKHPKMGWCWVQVDQNPAPWDYFLILQALTAYDVGLGDYTDDELWEGYDTSI